MLEALWSVDFRSNVSSQTNAGTGIAVLETNRVLGGDGMYTYVGAYHAPGGNRLEAEIEVRKYLNVPQPQSIFGPADQFHLKLAGVPAQSAFKMTGYVVERPELTIDINFVRRAELP